MVVLKRVGIKMYRDEYIWKTNQKDDLWTDRCWRALRIIYCTGNDHAETNASHYDMDEYVYHTDRPRVCKIMVFQ
jgi:hypothetical protein